MGRVGKWMKRTLQKLVLFGKKVVATSSCFFALICILISFLALVISGKSAELVMDAAEGNGVAVTIVTILGTMFGVVGQSTGIALFIPEGAISKSAAALGLPVELILGIIFLICLIIFNILLFLFFSIFTLFFLLLVLLLLRYVNKVIGLVTGFVTVIGGIFLIFNLNPFLLLLSVSYITIGTVLTINGVLSIVKNKGFFDNSIENNIDDFINKKDLILDENILRNNKIGFFCPNCDTKLDFVSLRIVDDHRQYDVPLDQEDIIEWTMSDYLGKNADISFREKDKNRGKLIITHSNLIFILDTNKNDNPDVESDQLFSIDLHDIEDLIITKKKTLAIIYRKGLASKFTILVYPYNYNIQTKGRLKRRRLKKNAKLWKTIIDTAIEEKESEP